MSSPARRTPEIELLDSFYRIFMILGVVFLTIGVPFVFLRKGASAAVCVALIAIVAGVWRLSRSGRPQLSMGIFSILIWLLGVSLIFLGMPPHVMTIMLAVAIMLCIVVSIRAGAVYALTMMLAWGTYIVLRHLDLAPQPYFYSRQAVSWFVSAFAVWLVLLPVPKLVGRMHRASSLQRATIEATADGILVISNDGGIESYNQRFIDMWQVPTAALDTGRDQAVLAGVLDQLEDSQQFIEKVQQLYAQPDASSRDLVRLKDGRIFERRSFPQRLDGKVVGRVWSFRDITEATTADAELRIAATAFDSQEAIMITDDRDTILRVNRAFTDATGYAPDEVLGKQPALLRSGHHNDNFYEGLRERLRNAGSWQGEIWNRRKNGEVYPNWTTITAVKNADGEITHYVTTQTDITQRKSAEEEIRHLAFYDPLTQLPNRRLLMDRLRHAIVSCARSGKSGALMFIDLDNFKILNDTLGHDQGDELLRQVGERLPWCVRDTDTVARLGGDEFVVMLEDLSPSSHEAAIQAETVGEKILTALNQPYRLVGHKHHCSPSIGVALFSQAGGTVEEIVKRADLAMYQAKSAGKNCLRFFDPEMQAAVNAHAQLEEELRQALERAEFCLYFQPLVDAGGRVVGAEALLRWQHPSRGLVPPIEFIPVAEQTGIILQLGQWVLETACWQLLAWSQRPETAHLSLAVNVSARQFRQAGFVDQVLTALEATGADPRRLKLELTESLLLDDVEDVIAKMAALKAQGVGFSLDDFGTGYSSLSYLKRLPLDQLKIDRAFVRDVLSSQSDAAIARTIVTLGQHLNLKVVAEGIETGAQWEFLKLLNCQSYQGFLFGKPVPLAQFDSALEHEAASC